MSFRGVMKAFSVAAMAALAVSFSGNDLLAQPGGRGGFMGGGSGLGLLGSESVQKELDLVEDQVDEIGDLQQEMRSEMTDIFRSMQDEMRGGDRQAAFEKIREKMQEVNSKYDKRTEKILLPHQWSRLQQIVAQSEARRGGGASSGRLPQSVIDELGITDEQIEEMQKKAEEVRKTMEEKIAKIRKQAEAEILSVLDPEQRKKYEEMMGDPFTFDDRGGRFGGGPGGRGGRGGAPGAGGRGGRGGDNGGGREDF